MLPLGHKISGPKTPVYMLQVISSNGTFVFQVGILGVDCL